MRCGEDLVNSKKVYLCLVVAEWFKDMLVSLLEEVTDFPIR